MNEFIKIYNLHINEKFFLFHRIKYHQDKKAFLNISNNDWNKSNSEFYPIKNLSITSISIQKLLIYYVNV